MLATLACKHSPSAVTRAIMCAEIKVTFVWFDVLSRGGVYFGMCEPLRFWCLMCRLSRLAENSP